MTNCHRKDDYGLQIVDRRFYPNVANLCRGKTRQGSSDAASRSLGKVEAYFTVGEILTEASKGADGVYWCESSGFGRFRFATLGFRLDKDREGVIDEISGLVKIERDLQRIIMFS